MWGAIIGDIAGSTYEYKQKDKVEPVKVDEIIKDDSFYSDDTILTVAIADAILHDKNYEKYLKEYATKYGGYLPDVKEYFPTVFSPGFTKWVEGQKEGNSTGNGAMMRISPVGYMFNTEKEVIENSKLATQPSHNTDEAIECATKIALIILYARQGYPKEEIIKKMNIELKYNEFERFNSTCSKTIDNCLYALFTSKSFEECITKVISYGGDTDTNAAIVGAMAEAMYGIDDKLVEKAKSKLPVEFVQIIEEAYKTNKKEEKESEK